MAPPQVTGPTPDLSDLQDQVVDSGLGFPAGRDELADEVGDYELKLPGGQNALLSDLLHELQTDVFYDWDDFEAQLEAVWTEARWRG